jgi:hypothetical protein
MIKKTWAIQFEGKLVPLKRDYHVLDLFDYTKADFKRLSPSIPVAYFSSQYEEWRPDAAQFGKRLGKLDDWDGEEWIDIHDEKNRNIFRSRLKLAKDKGAKAIDVDNVDLYGYGKATEEDTLKWIKWMIDETHNMGMLYCLKNALEIFPKISSDIDLAINEQGIEYKEIQKYKNFNKPVLNMEYKKPKKSVPYVYTLWFPDQNDISPTSGKEILNTVSAK